MRSWTAQARRTQMNREWVMPPMGRPEGMSYTTITPEDGSGKLKVGDKWIFYIVEREEYGWIKTATKPRYGMVKRYLKKIEKARGKNGSACYTWDTEPEAALIFGHKPDAERAAEEARGKVRMRQRIYTAEGPVTEAEWRRNGGRKHGTDHAD